MGASCQIQVSFSKSHYSHNLLCFGCRSNREQKRGEGVIRCPPANSTPAITAVVHNQSLFKALIACLSCPPGEADSDSRIHQPSGRKRTASFAEMPESAASKSLKMAHSPQVSKRTYSSSKPLFSVKPLAATILFSAFEYLDHWPVPLIKAYAEDCFGTRSWVDEPACQLLAENLALAHAESLLEDEDNEFAASALVVAEFYKLQERVQPGRTSPNSPNQQLARGSISFISSQLSCNAPSMAARQRSMSVGSVEPPKLAVAASSEAQGPDSDAGYDSSSGEEDEEVVLATKSFDEENVPRSMEAQNDNASSEASERQPLTYPILQENLNLIRVRQRYFGLNLEYAHLAIATSLSDRLDVKSKQNSGLLQCLPSFTSIPSVRKLITGNLEKWLQSPALSGLARSLFANTVHSMKNVDPPLPADLEAIDNILSMRLKANQVGFQLVNMFRVIWCSHFRFFSSMLI